MDKAGATFTVIFFLLGGILTANAAFAADNATKDTSDAKIFLSNSYAGNSWRQVMLDTWRAASHAAVKKGIIAKTNIVNANNSVSQQNNQISNMILQGADAIVIDAASTTGLNGTIQKACNAGITVVVFDALATADCAYKVATNYVYYGKFEANYAAKHFDHKFNVLEIRGIAGTSVDHDIHEGIIKGFSGVPNANMVASVHGKWTQNIAQKEVAGILASLPRIDVVVTQGGDGYGAYKAFEAAGRPIPMIIFGNRKSGLEVWQKLIKQKEDYETTSISSTPGMASVAFWVAQQILAGRDVPKKIWTPILHIQKDHLKDWIAATPDGGVATPVYSQEWTIQLIKANKKDKPLPEVPLPDQG